MMLLGYPVAGGDNGSSGSAARDSIVGEDKCVGVSVMHWIRARITSRSRRELIPCQALGYSIYAHNIYYVK